MTFAGRHLIGARDIPLIGRSPSDDRADAPTATARARPLFARMRSHRKTSPAIFAARWKTRCGRALPYSTATDCAISPSSAAEESSYLRFPFLGTYFWRSDARGGHDCPTVRWARPVTALLGGPWRPAAIFDATKLGAIAPTGVQRFRQDRPGSIANFIFMQMISLYTINTVFVKLQGAFVRLMRICITSANGPRATLFLLTLRKPTYMGR